MLAHRTAAKSDVGRMGDILPSGLGLARSHISSAALPGRDGGSLPNSLGRAGEGPCRGGAPRIPNAPKGCSEFFRPVPELGVSVGALVELFRQVEQLRAEVAHLRFAGLDARTRGDASDANDVKEEVDDAREQCLRREFCRAEDEDIGEWPVVGRRGEGGEE